MPARKAPLPRHSRIGGNPATPLGKRLVRITAGRVALTARLRPTRTAELIWQALPLHAVAEPWGECLHFEIPIESGRERTARWNVTAGEIAYWPDDERIMIGYGPTPISRPTEIRLMAPCNIWADALDDVRLLARVRVGDRVEIAELGV